MTRFLVRLDRAIALGEKHLLVLLLSGMIGFAFLQVVLRNLFHTGLIWAEPLLRHLVLWLGMLGASLATRQKKHISIDVVTRFLPPSMQRGLDLVCSFVSTLLCLLLLRASWDFVQDERVFGSLFVGAIPLWPLQLILPVGFALLALRFALHTLHIPSPGEEE